MKCLSQRKKIIRRKASCNFAGTKTKTMKRLNNTKFLILSAGFLAACTACNWRSGQDADPVKIAENQNETALNDKGSDLQKDARFLVQAADINLSEIQLGQLAQKKSTTDHVQELGKLMENEHTKSQEELLSLAAHKSITLPEAPSRKSQDVYKDLIERTGKDFDKKFCDLMINRHKEAIDIFEKASSSCNDADVRTWAIDMLPKLRAHLDHAHACRDKTE
jgi:putative membrane protein